MTRTVFISHSCEDNPALPQASRDIRARARAVRDQIERGLEDIEGLTAWIDRDQVDAGQQWRKEIHSALFECAAGVILFDSEAFASPWVLKETTVLSVRRSLLPNFPMVPVLLDQGSSAEFDKRPEWKALGMREIQAMKKEPDEVASAVIELIKDAAVPKPTSFELWIDDIWGILHSIGPQRSRFDEIADLLVVPHAADWSANDRRAIRTLALALVGAKPATIVVAVRELASLPPDRRAEIKRLLMPAWVKPERAAVAAFGLRSTDVGRRLVLASDDEFIAEEHLRRAECCSGKLRVCRTAIAQGEDDSGDLLYAACAASIYAGFPMAKGLTGQKFADCLADFLNPPVVLRVAPGAMQVATLKSVLDRVQVDFPGVGVLLLTDDATVLADDLAPPTPLTLIPTLTPEEIMWRTGFEGELDLFVKGSTG